MFSIKSKTELLNRKYHNLKPLLPNESKADKKRTLRPESQIMHRPKLAGYKMPNDAMLHQGIRIIVKLKGSHLEITDL